jgi:nucleoside-diphosphate-sugar epimerase
MALPLLSSTARSPVMNILITGATGVIGRRLVPLLYDAGHQVTAVARSAAGHDRLARQGAATIDLDLFDPAAVRGAVAGRDVVINLATHIPRTPLQMFMPWQWRENDRIRRIASATLAEASLAAGVPRFIQESFAPVYPERGARWIDESVPIQPVRYNRTVADAEASAGRFSERGGTGIVLRFGGFYGPDAAQTIAMADAVRKGWAPLPGRADAFISSVSHDDAASAAAAAINLTAGIYNVVDDVPVTHREFFESLADALGTAAPRLPPVWMTPMLGSLAEMAARSLRISNRTLRSASEWAPKYPSVREGWPTVVAQMRTATAPTHHPAPSVR